MSEEKKGIKELTEVIVALEILTDALGKTMKDGTIGLSDLPHLLNLLKEYEKFIDAVKGAPDIVEELKDIDEHELLLLGKKVFGLIKRVREVLDKD